MSKADRFTGINPLKFVHFPWSSAHTEFKRDVLSPKQLAFKVKKIIRPSEQSQPVAQNFLMQASGKFLSPREPNTGVRLNNFD